MTTPDPSGECLLHVFLLTYNREQAFRRTLETIAASPLKDHPLTVMDNCSTDGTPLACEEFRPLLPRMEVRRHVRNIGFGANFLRCLEWSQGEYTWVLCDDDALLPERVEGFLNLLRTHRPQACFIGGPRQGEWPSGPAVLPSEIQRKCGTFITASSFVPTLVFRSSLIGSSELVDGYFAIRTNFPQLVIGRKLFTEDIPCAILQPPLIERGIAPEKTTNGLDIAAGWSAFCLTLPPAYRRQAFYSFFERQNSAGMLKQTLRMVIWARIDGVANPDYHLRQIGLNAGLRARMVLSIARVACMIPGSAYHLAREAYRKVKYGWMARPLPPTYHAQVIKDELRR